MVFLIQELFSGQNDYVQIFKTILMKYNINYDQLDKYKAGALCIPIQNKSYNNYAVGFSYKMYDKNYASSVALKGCKEMKKKEISYECKCEKIL